MSITSWKMQSSIEYDWVKPKESLVLAPLGNAEGKWGSIKPFLNLLTIVPLLDTTKHRFPAGLANTYLHIKTKTKTKNKT